MLLGYIIYELHCKKVNHILEIFVIQKNDICSDNFGKILNLRTRHSYLLFLKTERKRMDRSLNINLFVDEERENMYQLGSAFMLLC